MNTTVPVRRDTFSDTWEATDALGRSVATHPVAGAPRPDRFVGMFYFLWLAQHGSDGPYDIPKVLAQDPQAMLKPDSPLWGPAMKFHHWGESLFGYYSSTDEWVFRKHAQMLSDAQVDVLIFDVTNQATYSDPCQALGRAFTAARQDGCATPQIAFLTPFWGPGKVVRTLYEEIYKPGLFRDLWFLWRGKPLIMADPDQVEPELRDFFTFRKPQPSYFQGPTGPNEWGWLEVFPQHIFRDEAGHAEQMTVGVGQNAQQAKRLCAFSEADSCGRNWHDGANDTRPNAVRLGLNFAEQFNYALKNDPEFIFVTGWNEWIAMRLPDFNGVTEPVMFVDAFDHERSRDIEPMRGGHGDDYYYQLVDFVRRYKGARPQLPAGSANTIRLADSFRQWNAVTPEFRDDGGDTAHRDHPGYDNVGRYVDHTGRNDFILLKVAHDADRVCFYARCANPITPRQDTAWMNLLISTGATPAWEGFDLLINRSGNESTATIERSAGAWNWTPAGQADLRVEGAELMLALPRILLARAGQKLDFTFKWTDNTLPAGDPFAFYTTGDTAPNARFRYRYFEAQ